MHRHSLYLRKIEVKMIIVSMGAGLGNQMFEYSFYYKLKKLYPNQKIFVDDKYAFPIAHNGIELFDIFGLSAEHADIKDIRKLIWNYPIAGNTYSNNRLINFLTVYLRIYPKSLKIQKDFTEYYDSFFNLSDEKSYYFYGPFANYKYFNDIKDEVINTFVFPVIEDKNNLFYKEKIENTQSVSIHIRRGDYIKEGIELVPEKFYKDAIKIIESKVCNATFFIFTDDINYAENLFPNKDKFVIVKGNSGVNSFRDMQLMSLCKHNITANSTFSFWGAYLNRNLDKIVIAPNIPFTGTKNPFVCEEWIKL